MKKEIIPINQFRRELRILLKKRKLSEKQYADFLIDIAQDPEQGDPIAGTGGLRKIRLQASSHGKRGGCRVCYYYFVVKERIYLIEIYAKNEKEDISAKEKKEYKKIIDLIKKESYHE